MALFGKKKKPDEGKIQKPQPRMPQFSMDITSQFNSTAAQQQKQKPKQQIATLRPGPWRIYIQNMVSKHAGLENTMREENMRETVYQFVQKMTIAALILGIILGLTLYIFFSAIGLAITASALFGALIGVSVFFVGKETFLNFPTRKNRMSSKNIERDILFAARDMIISLRSGMPLFNAITSISTGYGDASKEFAKIVERVQLGTSLEDSIDQVVAETKSVSFRRLMLQAAVSIKAGADVVSALQSVIDQLAQERIIELRRYGQRLNAIAMFYMLFGIIMPSMGIAVVTILTTFIALFTVTDTVLGAVIVGIVFLQIIFLALIRGSRPAFSM